MNYLYLTFVVFVFSEDDDTAPAVQSASLKSQPQQQLFGSKVRSSQSGVAAENRSRSEAAPGRSKEVVSANPQRQLPDTQNRQLSEDMEDVMEGDDGEIRRSNRLERLLRQQMAAKASAAEAAAAEDLFVSSSDGLRKQYSDSYIAMSAQSSTVGSKHSIGSSEQELSKYLSTNDTHRPVEYNSHAVLPPGGGAGGGPIPRSRSVDTLNKETDGSYSVTYRSPDSTPTPSGRQQYGGTRIGEYDKTSGYSVDFPANDILTSTPSRDYKMSSEYHEPRVQDHHGDGYASSIHSTSSVAASHSGSEDPRREIGYLEQSQGLLYSGTSHQPAIRTPLVTTRTTLATRPSGTDREVSGLIHGSVYTGMYWVYVAYTHTHTHTYTPP